MAKNMNSKPKKNIPGEGSYTATRDYQKSLEHHLKEADTEKLGKQARKAVESEEGEELREAEEEGKKRARH